MTPNEAEKRPRLNRTFNLRVDPILYTAIQEICERFDISPSCFTRQALRRSVDAARTKESLL